MTEHTLDITGKGCPYALLFVRKKLKTLNTDDVLIVKCDHPPAALNNIPTAMEKDGNEFSREQIEPGLWKLKITKK